MFSFGTLESHISRNIIAVWRLNGNPIILVFNNNLNMTIVYHLSKSQRLFFTLLLFCCCCWIYQHPHFHIFPWTILITEKNYIKSYLFPCTYVFLFSSSNVFVVWWGDLKKKSIGHYSLDKIYLRKYEHL